LEGREVETGAERHALTAEHDGAHPCSALRRSPASASAWNIAPSSALRLSGRFIRTSATPSEIVTLTRSDMTRVLQFHDRACHPALFDEAQTAGVVDGSASGRSTTNSVRWAGKMCSLRRMGARPCWSSAVRSAAPDCLRDSKQRRVGRARGRRSYGLRRTAQGDAEELVERLAFDVGTAHVLAELRGHHTVTIAKGSPSARFTRFTRNTCWLCSRAAT
jgi:hypothetical protein